MKSRFASVEPEMPSPSEPVVRTSREAGARPPGRSTRDSRRPQLLCAHPTGLRVRFTRWWWGMADRSLHP